MSGPTRPWAECRWTTSIAALGGRGRDVVEQLIGDAGLRPICLGGTDQDDTVDGMLRLGGRCHRREDGASLSGC
ncbi:MAG: hypothetical protein ACYDAL_10865 [Candidatus Dormibacteraceae bacterium]